MEFNFNDPKVVNNPRYLSMVSEGMNPKLAFFGTWYGYPTCCVKFFKTRFFDRNFLLTENQEKVHDNKGFIPCSKCADKLVTESLDTKSLLIDRICPLEFPNDEMGTK